MKFKQYTLKTGVRLYMCETDKFKTTTCKMFLQQDLQADRATSTALIPLLLRRGSQKFPSTLQIAQELEELYAADFGADVLKIGERQILSFTFQMADPGLLPDGERLLERGLTTFWDIATRPAGPEDAFIDSFFRQEKQSLRQELEGLVNEKRSYAIVRAMAHMCAEEPFGIYKYGDLETLASLQNSQVHGHFQDLVSDYPLDIFLVGSNLDTAVEILGELVEGREQVPELMQPEVVQVKNPRFFQESMEMQQAVLVMGYRTNCSYLDEDYYPLLVGNGILGGFPHSKLFMNVREKASLAYYVGSALEGSKGIILVSAGINETQRERATEIIGEQLAELQQGQISREELEQTKEGLTSNITAMNDNPVALIDRNVIGLVHDELRTTEQVAEAINNVQIDDVVRAMNRVVLDTTYILANGEREGDSHGAN